jgi:outer membrane protein TolC
MKWAKGRLGWVLVVLKVTPMLDELRTRALVLKATGVCSLSIAGLSLVPILSGCILNSERPDISLDVPPAYRAGRGVSAPPTLDWWRGFRSPELTRLIEEAQTKNLDIAVAIALIIEADALSKIATAPLLPQAGLNVSATRSRGSQTTGQGGTGAGGPSERELYTAILNASYEIDFLGQKQSGLARRRGKRRC